jgi:hypothetical protein
MIRGDQRIKQVGDATCNRQLWPGKSEEQESRLAEPRKESPKP